MKNFKAVTSLSKLSSEDFRTKYMLKNLKDNLALKLNKKKKLNLFKKEYLEYRRLWTKQPEILIKKKIFGKLFEKKRIIPLCLDIEVASVCDLACPHCFRQFITTPDKIIDEQLCYNLIDQASSLGIPSIKFNWRGEPLLHPKLDKFIHYAKQKGILETIINTNATKLNEDLSIKLINSGLDLLIFSFDGGTKESYEKLRPGRFKKNKFKDIYNNIRNFNKIRKKLNKKFPATKIQMVLTDETFYEQKEFLKLFKDFVDDVSVKQYSERGGNIKDLEEKNIKANNIKSDSIFLRKPDGTILVSNDRIPCSQPFQRLLITYDGRVSMCCYDWGAMHPVGYVSELGLKLNNKHYEEVKENILNKKKGFDMMLPEIPKIYSYPEKKVQSLAEIWNGKEINKIREAHINNDYSKNEICKKCTFKETFSWKKVQ